MDTTRALSVCVCGGGGSVPLGELLDRGQSLTSSRFRASTPDFSLRLSPEVLSTSGYIRKTAGVFKSELSSS